jgi:hypothetical protein
MDIEPIVEALRQDAQARCLASDKDAKPLCMLEEYERKALLVLCHKVLYKLGVDTHNRACRLAFWRQVFNISVASSNYLPKGYVLALSAWAARCPEEAQRIGRTFTTWYEQQQEVA